MGCCATKRDVTRDDKAADDEFPDKDSAFSKRLAEIYRKYDTNNDGCLDREETRELLNAVLKDQGKEITEEDLEQFITAADANNDGMIQKRELYDLYKKLNRQAKKK